MQSLGDIHPKYAQEYGGPTDMKPSHRKCPVCEQGEVAVVFENEMAPVGGFDMSYSVGCCCNCGFHFAHQLPDTATYGSYYQAVSKYDAPGATSAVDQARVDAAVQFCEHHIGKDAVIADLGCGYGALLGGFHAAGWTRLQGIDPAPMSAKCALERYGLTDIHQATMAQAHEALNLAEVDLVCCMAVLEHLPGLRQDLGALLQKLRAGCKVLVEVPAIECFSAANNEPHGELSLEHIQFFSQTSLRNLFNSLGARTIALELLPLPMVASGSLFGLFDWGGVPSTPTPFEVESGGAFSAYVAESSQQMKAALSRIPEGPVIIFGAGSHTARLLPQLERKTGCDVVAIVDNNPNLTGKTMGQWVIQAKDWVYKSPSVPILVSSFRAQGAIAESLRTSVQNPLILLYGQN